MVSKDFDVASIREVFYMGGEYATVTVGNKTGKYMFNQLYVEKLTPVDTTCMQSYPIVFIAGAGQTGTNFLETPDGRSGWAHFFLSKGYTVYLSDQPSRGRSAWHPSTGSMASLSTSDVETLFTNTSSHNLWPQSKLHTQWPGTGKAGDPTFDAFFASQVQFQADRKIAEDQNAKAYAALLDRTGEAYIVAHSQAAAYAWRVADARPALMKAIIALDPSGPPVEKEYPFLGQTLQWGITDQEITYEPSAGPQAENLSIARFAAKDEMHTKCILQQEPAKKLINIVGIPVLVVTAEASYHAPYDYCTVAYLQQAGVSVEHLELGEEGFKGNGHMMFMEKNDMEIAERLYKWLHKH